MARKLYDVSAVWKYVENIGEAIDIIEGCLIDTYIIYHDGGITEVWEETYVNEWNSAYTRHIYRAGLPKRFVEALEAQY